MDGRKRKEEQKKRRGKMDIQMLIQTLKDKRIVLLLGIVAVLAVIGIQVLGRELMLLIATGFIILGFLIHKHKNR